MKLNDVDLKKVSIFCQVVESGNYRLASEVLNVTPSALSQTITSLEHALGSPLFDRVGKRLKPNQNGLKLHREFRRTHCEFIKAIQSLSTGRDRVAGVLRIGAYLEFAKLQLAPVVQEFLKKYPEAQVKFIFDSPSRLHRLLETGQLDICFSIYPSIQTKTVASRPVYHEELVVIAAPGLIRVQPTYADLLAAPVIDYFPNHQPMRQWLYLHFKKRPKKLSTRVFAASAEMVLALVCEGAGIGIVPKFLLDARENRKPVEVIRPTARQFLDHIWLLEKKAPSRAAIHEVFGRYVAEHFAAP